jgi:hypothetical protein
MLAYHSSGKMDRPADRTRRERCAFAVVVIVVEAQEPAPILFVGLRYGVKIEIHQLPYVHWDALLGVAPQPRLHRIPPSNNH